MKEIKTETIGQAWIQACGYILDKGGNIKDNGQEVKEALNLLITVKKHKKEDEILERYADKESIKWMLSNFLEQKKIPELGNAESYGTRLFNFKGKNQINWVIEKLKKKPGTKAATISLIMQEDEAYIPCVSAIDFKIRKGKLILTAMCRAIDFGKKIYANLLALRKVQEMVSEKVNVPLGQLVVYNVSAHIYEEDYDKIKKILEEVEND